jgi:iron(III) transport system substrate-binding protein
MRILVSLSMLAVALAGCGGGDGSSSDGGGSDGGNLTIYSGREEELVSPLLDRFEQSSGVDVEVRYGDSAELAATIAEEGDNSPADVFFAQDPGSLGALEGEQLLAELPEEILDRVPERFRDSDRRWVGTSGRVRVIAYNTDEVPEGEVPDSVYELTDPKWKGKVGIAPTNASFQAFVTAMRLADGNEKTREWLEGMKANDVKVYERNTPIVEAVAAGEIQLGLVNHYYLGLVKEESPGAPVANHYLSSNDPGALVSVAGAGIVEGTDDEDTAREFVQYLLSDEGQRFYAEEAEEAEYPVVDGIAPKGGIEPIANVEGPAVQLDAFGAELEETLELLREVGFTT